VTDIHAFFAEHLLPIIDANHCRDVCDYGCGEGELLRVLREKRPDLNLTGIDYFGRYASREGFEAQDFNGIATIDREGAEYEALLTEPRFDMVISTFAIHHFRTPVQELRQLTGLARPGGLAVFFDHCVDLSSEAGIVKALQSGLGEIYATLKGGYHRRHYTLAEAQDLFLAVPVEMVEAIELRCPFTEEETRENAMRHAERTTKIIGFVEESTDFWKSVFHPLLNLERSMLEAHGLDFGLLMRLTTRRPEKLTEG
jgi:SAM-dependent methyltransferase